VSFGVCGGLWIIRHAVRSYGPLQDAGSWSDDPLGLVNAGDLGFASGRERTSGSVSRTGMALSCRACAKAHLVRAFASWGVLLAGC